MRLIDNIIRRSVRSQMTLPLKERIGKRLRETYYNAEVLYRIESKTEPLNCLLDGQRHACVNLLIPEINFASFYGGYMAKFHLAKKLLENGYRVRLVVVDPSVHAPETWRTALEDYPGLEGIFDELEVAYQGDRKETLAISGEDRFIATTWWTAYLANDLVQRTGGPPFMYLIQEYEPFTFPMGSYYAMADHSYSFPHHAVFSSALLKDYFRLQGIGVFDGRASPGGAEHFENAICKFEDIELSGIRETGSRERKLLFYARPEAHATRNMFEVGFLALAKAIEDGVFEGHWEFHGIGSAHGDIDLPGGRKLKMLGKFSLGEYRKALLEYDLGLSLMYTPHPSLLPLDMAAAGIVVVTNSCMNKTPERLRELSTNLIGAEPHIEGVSTGLRRARERIDDIPSRLKGANVNWAGQWDEAFHDGLMEKIRGWLG